MEMMRGVWKQHLRPRAVVGYGVKTFLPSPPNYVTRSPGSQWHHKLVNVMITGLEITASQQTMSGLIVDLTGQTYVLPVILTGQNSIVLKMKLS